jgi:hypothetical protein
MFPRNDRIVLILFDRRVLNKSVTRLAAPVISKTGYENDHRW